MDDVLNLWNNVFCQQLLKSRAEWAGALLHEFATYEMSALQLYRALHRQL